MSASRDQLNKFLSEIDITDKVVLDVGVQDKPTSRLTKGEAAEYLTNDIDAQWNPDILGDLNDSEFFFPGRGTFHYVNYFDIVFCIEVLEHCWNPIQAVKNIFSMLKPGGIAYFSSPFINPHHDYTDYARYTNEWYRDVLVKCSFDVVAIEERVATNGRGLLEAFFKIEGMRVSKIRPEFGKYTYPIGYFVIARKK